VEDALIVAVLRRPVENQFLPGLLCGPGEVRDGENPRRAIGVSSVFEETMN
jgi:hypothetical protein